MIAWLAVSAFASYALAYCALVLLAVTQDSFWAVAALIQALLGLSLFVLRAAELVSEEQ